MYDKILKYLCKRRIRQITNEYPMTLDQLINYHDYMACISFDSNQRVLGVSLQSAIYLEKLKERVNYENRN